MVFNTISTLFTGASAPIHAILKLFLPVLSTILFPSHWLLSHITIGETMDSSERGMNTVTMTLINPWKEYWPSLGVKPATFCSQDLYTTN